MTDERLIPIERIEKGIFVIRGQKVLIDTDLAALYGVETKALNRAVKRNIERFPEDFMFQLTADEAARLRCQFGTLETAGGSARGRHRKYLPYAFTEQGVAMVSGLLNSPRAILVNIEIMRAFVRLRQMLRENAALARRLDALEARYDAQFKAVFDAIRELMTPPVKPKRQIGFGESIP
jgi:hypothetical protein